ncbi:hypothetical protein ARMSODRAFT_1017290 [Armillaria solidipes]|uniref:CCHC-type domain-containing protein n=1 Tax=Armillaria solidipes TaxID=1076256 RepID=A0A2H3C3J8_9AGAR|nr:hypothetical protein ARMSODRAFT_1017290 [Armillaria solidipes]
MSSSSDKKTGTGTIYGKCFRCGKKGHLSKDCLKQQWNKKKEEVRAAMTEPATDSKIEKVKDAAEK